MRNASYREVINVQEYVKSSEDDYGRSITTPTTRYSLRARWMHTGGNETFRGRQIQADIVGVFEVRYHASINIDPTMSLVHVNDSNKRYEIYSVRPSECKSEGGFKTIEIFVKSIAT